MKGEKISSTIFLVLIRFLISLKAIALRSSKPHYRLKLTANNGKTIALTSSAKRYMDFGEHPSLERFLSSDSDSRDAKVMFPVYK